MNYNQILINIEWFMCDERWSIVSDTGWYPMNICIFNFQPVLHCGWKQYNGLQVNIFICSFVCMFSEEDKWTWFSWTTADKKRLTWISKNADFYRSCFILYTYLFFEYVSTLVSYYKQNTCNARVKYDGLKKWYNFSDCCQTWIW